MPISDRMSDIRKWIGYTGSDPCQRRPARRDSPMIPHRAAVNGRVLPALWTAGAASRRVPNLENTMIKKLLAGLALLASMSMAFAQVEVNKADAAALDGIKGIGPAKSKAIKRACRSRPGKAIEEM